MSLDEDVSTFRKEVTDEIASEEQMLQKLQEPIPTEIYFHFLSVGLIALMAALIFLQNSIFFTWLIVGILLYSYNWLIFFLPTTTESVRPEDADVAPQIDKERRWYVIRLLIKERKLGIEMGLTMFLGGILPVALSFTIIFGLAASFAAYFGYFTHFIAGGTANFIIIQITLILLFYVMMLIIKPQAQGITKIGRYFRDRIKVARAKGTGAMAALVLTIAVLSLVASILVFGAILLPGFLTPVLWGDVNFLSLDNIPIIAVVLVSQLVVMRHFQGIVSREMAERRVRDRLLELNNDVLIKLDELAFMQDGEKKKTRLENLKGKYYSIAIYDLIDQDIFGYSRIYLFGVRLRYVLDEDVVLSITNMTKRVLKEKQNEVPKSSKEWMETTPVHMPPEHHKEAAVGVSPSVDADLENFEKFWKNKGSTVKVKGEYHKAGAPDLDSGAGGDKAGGPRSSAMASAEPEGASGTRTADSSKDSDAMDGATAGSTCAQSSGGAGGQRMVQKIDLGMIEMASYTLFKAAFKNGLSVPIKREGVVDMDLVVKGKEITVNTNQLYFTFPDLTVWHIVYTHKGKPIAEMGRGVKNGLKIHRYNAIRLGLEAWNGTRKTNKQKKKQYKEMEKEAHQRPMEE